MSLRRNVPSLWVSPWAARPLPFHLPLETRTAKDNGEVFLAAEATASADTVFELPSDWPVFADLGAKHAGIFPLGTAVRWPLG